MKRQGFGQAKVLTPDEVQQLLAALPTPRDRAIAAIGLYTGCRISEICSLLTADVYDATGEVLPILTVRKPHTKGQLGTRQIPVHPHLATYLRRHQPGTIYVFPSRWHQWKPLNPRSWDALAQAGITGASTHSFRRTCLTRLSNAGVPLRVIQAISGHRSLNTLQAYLEVHPDQLRQAIAQLD